MSDTSRTDDSVPSLSSYPPAFVSLITTFIRRAEEAETRAHKALVILNAKDQQVLQLQQRMEVLENIASRLEEVIVPPLDLPRSPESCDEIDSYHPRNCDGPGGRRTPPNPPLETLYERYPAMQQTNDSAQELHNCYTRCQHLIDGLERSNCQLREALTAESQQRVKDHEQYVATLARVTKAVKSWQGNKTPSDTNNLHLDQVIVQALQGASFSKSIYDEVTSILGAAGDNKANSQNNAEPRKNASVHNSQLAILDKEDFKEKVNMAERIIKTLQKRLEKGGNRPNKRSRAKPSRKIKLHKSSRSSISSYHTPQSCPSFKPKPKYRSLHCFFTAVKRENKQLKTKYQNVCEKLRESLILCGKLEEAVASLTEEKLTKQNKQLVEKFTQTGKMLRSEVWNDRPEKPKSSRSVHLLQGRLDAAAKVMAKQYKQIQDLQQQLIASHSLVDSLRKRLSRAESSAAGQDLLGKTARRQLLDTEDRNSALTQEVQRLKDSVDQFNEEISTQKEISAKLEKEKESNEKKFEEIKRTMESKLVALSSTLQQQEEMSQRARGRLETQLLGLQERFVAQVSEAGEQLVAADSKIQELYLGIETFLKLLFGLQHGSTPELSPSSQAEAVQVASQILQLPLGQLQTFLYSSRLDNHLVNKWIKECNRLVHNIVFAKDLGHFLLDAVLEAKIS